MLLVLLGELSGKISNFIVFSVRAVLLFPSHSHYLSNRPEIEICQEEAPHMQLTCPFERPNRPHQISNSTPYQGQCDRKIRTTRNTFGSYFVGNCRRVPHQYCHIYRPATISCSKRHSRSSSVCDINASLRYCYATLRAL